jgi:hypothetical protein
VSPAYGNVSLALVKYRNEGGPGPRYNMKEVPGSTLIMLVVHAYPEPLSSEAGDQKTRSVGLPPPPPHQSNLGKAPSRPLQVHTPPLAKMQIETRLSGNHTSASDSRSEAIDWARGGCGLVETILGFSARLYEVGQLSWRPAQVNRALITSKALQEIRLGRYNQDTTMAGRYGAEVYIRGTVVPLHHQQQH